MRVTYDQDMSYRHPVSRAPQPARRATRDRQLHRKWGNMQLSRSRARTRQYPEGMPHVSDTDSEDRARRNFSAWLQRVIDDYKSRGVSKSALARQSGVNRNDVDRWLKRETFPLPRTVMKFCQNLGLDYSEPARILGWDTSAQAQPDPADAADYIARAKKLAAHPGTSHERRVVIEARIAAMELARRTAASSRLAARQAEEMERNAESLLREALEDPEGASDG